MSLRRIDNSNGAMSNGPMTATQMREALSMRDTEKTPTERLATPVQYLSGVGPKRAELLARLELHAAVDLLFFFPRVYRDYTDIREIDELEEDQVVSVVGTVYEIELRPLRSGGSLLGVLIGDGEQFIRAIWFNQAYMKNKLREGQRVLVSGKPRLNGGRWEISHPQIENIGTDQETVQPQLAPVYPLTRGINQYRMRKIVTSAVEFCADAVQDVFNSEYRERHDLLSIQDAIHQIHTPLDEDQLGSARRRFVYQEFFILQLALAVRRLQITHDGTSPKLERTAKIDARIRRLLPFELTAGQEKVIGEISADLNCPHSMNRLLQGDVGSGKTVVALYAMLLAVAQGFQAVIMAPTEILAVQHYESIGRLLEQGRVRLGLLTGSQTKSQREKLLAEIQAGEIDIVIGTQAIVQSGAAFSKLAIVVIDEQHKFGVRQRALLKTAGENPHYLVMTATPIPRTVTMALFGDLDVSLLQGAPPDRREVKTYLVDGEEQVAKWWDFFRRKLKEGRQGYVVAPLVEEDNDGEIDTVFQTYEALANGELEAFRAGFIHGRMKADEKQIALRDFSEGKTQVLVASSVVEVGIDVPNATLMTILSAQRFGLAQLHQLRGRISRGKQTGYCAVMAEIKSEPSRHRLQALVGSTDGFELAETDFDLRGPGDLFGTNQHGLPPLRIADLRRDQELLIEARNDARELLEADPGLAQPGHDLLRRRMLAKYGRELDLGDVG